MDTIGEWKNIVSKVIYGIRCFFSYPHKDAEEVKQILQALQAEGLNVWIDKSEINDFASISISIFNGLAHSKALLAYYSQNYWLSRACQWELTAGFLAAQHEGDPRKRVFHQRR
jgi:hypothetical protein